VDSELAAPPSADDLRFIFASGRLSLDLCATVGERWRRGFERLRSPGDLTRWYAEAAVATAPVLVTEPGLSQARAVRDAIYRSARAVIDGRQPSASDGEVINQAATAPPPVPHLQRGVLTIAAAEPDQAASALSAVARDAITLLTAGDAARLRECASQQCGLLFTDTSRPGRRRWCSSSSCGGRARAAAYRQRHAPSRGGRD
jgi:predicted RNA-binding Zn ribbon-like protein